MDNLKILKTNDDFENRLTELEKATVNLINGVAETNVRIDKLIDAQKETNERLNAVIFMVEKFLGSQNGKKE